MAQTVQYRNNGIDILRTICAFMIICIHEAFPGTFGEVVRLISRVAVPMFFMITGFYYEDICNHNRQKQQIKKIFNLTVVTMLFYVVYEFLKQFFVYHTVGKFINDLVSLEALKRLFIYNYSVWGGQLWYLRALLYVLIIALILKKIINKKWFLYIAIGLYVIGLIIGIYSKFVFGIRLSMYRERNFLFTGIPFFVFGINLKSIINKYSEKLLLILTLVFCATSIAEFYIMLRFGSYGELYISTPFFAASLLLFMFQHYENKEINQVERIFANIGRKYSMMIFVSHLAIINLLNFSLGLVSIPFLNYIAPILLFILCIAFAYVFYKILNIFKRKNT